MNEKEKVREGENYTHCESKSVKSKTHKSIKKKRNEPSRANSMKKSLSVCFCICRKLCHTLCQFFLLLFLSLSALMLKNCKHVHLLSMYTIIHLVRVFSSSHLHEKNWLEKTYATPLKQTLLLPLLFCSSSLSFSPLALIFCLKK